MDSYKQMYLHLFNAASKAMEILRQAQKDAEEIYLSGEEQHGEKDEGEEKGPP